MSSQASRWKASLPDAWSFPWLSLQIARFQASRSFLWLVYQPGGRCPCYMSQPGAFYCLPVLPVSFQWSQACIWRASLCQVDQSICQPAVQPDLQRCQIACTVRALALPTHGHVAHQTQSFFRLGWLGSSCSHGWGKWWTQKQRMARWQLLRIQPRWLSSPDGQTGQCWC